MCALTAGALIDSSPIYAADVRISGYVREHLASNLSDVPETPEDDKYDLAMARTTLLLQADADLGWAYGVAIGRLTREYMTGYLDRLEDLTALTGALNAPPLPRSDFQQQYNDEELREAYLDIPMGLQFTARIGKQQVVWGETDFFQAMDVIHGYDQTWRAFLEPENEEWRKPLWLLNLQYFAVESDTAVQVVLRPGIDDDDAMGNSLDTFGGRWSLNGSRGFNTAALIPVNYNHSKADADEPSYGIRLSGSVLGFGYSLNYYHTLSQDPVVNFADLSGGFNPTFRGYGEAPENGFAEFIYPEIDIFGATLNGYLAPINATFRAELAFTPDKPYNFGLANTPSAGGNGVIEKDTLRAMIGLDKPLRTQGWLGTSAPTSISLQLFDTWILDHEDSEQVVDFGSPKKEHSSILTALVMMPFRHDSVTFTFAVIYDLAYDGTILVPGLSLSFGDHWRVMLEADFFNGGRYKNSPMDPQGQSLIGAFHYSDQALARISYQF
ncbi:MAG: DUF1302 family protein [Pseudomonadota bacterium]|nr:DUF1302 family protein [Pseudomonadota bacterium]